MICRWISVEARSSRSCFSLTRSFWSARWNACWSNCPARFWKAGMPAISASTMRRLTPTPCSRPNTSMARVLISWSTIVSNPPSLMKRPISSSGSCWRSRSSWRFTWSETSVDVIVSSPTSASVSPGAAVLAPPPKPVSTPVTTTAIATKPSSASTSQEEEARRKSESMAQVRIVGRRREPARGQRFIGRRPRPGKLGGPVPAC
jgi:hypothetical protein